MKAILPSNAFSRFLFTSGILYFLLYLVYQFVFKKYTFYDQHFIGLIIRSAEVILNTFGYKSFKVLQNIDYQVIGVDGSNGVWIGSNCNALKLFGLYSVFIIGYPGPIKHKLWFIPAGIILIHFLNILRVVALALIARFYPDYLDFNHTYTFTFIVYGFILGLWLIWINRFSNQTISNEKGQN